MVQNLEQNHVLARCIIGNIYMCLLNRCQHIQIITRVLVFKFHAYKHNFASRQRQNLVAVAVLPKNGPISSHKNMRYPSNFLFHLYIYTSDTQLWFGTQVSTCSNPICTLRSHSLVYIQNNLFIIGIGPIINKEIKFIYRPDRSDCTYVYSQVSVYNIQYIIYIYKRNAKCTVFLHIKM